MFWLFWQLVGVAIAVGTIALAVWLIIAIARGIYAMLTWDY